MRYMLLCLVCLLGCSPMVYMGGVPNLDVADATRNVWRSGQISTPEGWATIKSKGVKRVVKLNYVEEGTDDLAVAAGLEVVYLPIPPKNDLASVFEKPSEETVSKAVRVLAMGDALAHCTHGQDRTGYTIGQYDVIILGKTRDQAFANMLAHNFHIELPALYESWLTWDGKLVPATVSYESELPITIF